MPKYHALRTTTTTAEIWTIKSRSRGIKSTKGEAAVGLSGGSADAPPCDAATHNAKKRKKNKKDKKVPGSAKAKKSGSKTAKKAKLGAYHTGY